MKKHFACVTLFTCLALHPLALHASEMRSWASRKGSVLEASLGNLKGDTVTLIDKDARQIQLKLDDLSLADRQYLVEFGGADPSSITSGKPGLVEKEMRVDSSAFKRLETKLSFPNGPQEAFELLETPHFLIATAGGVRPNAMAEAAERMWYGMAFQHMNFRTDWGDKRMLILLCEDREVYTKLGEWYAAFLADEADPVVAESVKLMWPEMGSSNLQLPEDMVNAHNLHHRAMLFNVREASGFRKALAPFLVHSLAGQLLGQQMGGVASYGSEGYFALITGHSYFKEISLAGKAETKLIAAEGTAKDEIGSVSGFDDGSSWARSLKPLVRSGKIKPELAPMLKWDTEDLTPERLVLIYSLACYMEGDLKRLSSYAKMIRRIESSNQIPVPEEIAVIFGFDSVDAFDADWSKFILSNEFK